MLLDPDGVEERIEKTVAHWGKMAEYFLDQQHVPDGATVLMANVYAPTDAAGQADNCFDGLNRSSLVPHLHDANTQLCGLAEDMAFSALDMRGIVLGHGFYDDDPANAEGPSLWFANDSIHPNPRGHHEIRAMFWRAIAGE